MTEVKFDSIYIWSGGMGCWFKSYEILPIGTVRCVRGKLFHVMYIHSDGGMFPFFRIRKYCCWVPVDQTYEPSEITKFKQSL